MMSVSLDLNFDVPDLDESLIKTLNSQFLFLDLFIFHTHTIFYYCFLQKGKTLKPFLFLDGMVFMAYVQL